MPNIVLPSGEVVYRPMSDSVWSVLSELVGGGINEVAVFNGKKLAVTADFAKVPHLTDQAKIYIVRRSGALPTSPASIDPEELQKYKQIYSEMTEEELHVIHEFISSGTGIHRALENYPALRTDHAGLDLIRNFSLFAELVFAEKLPPTHTYLFKIFVGGVEQILSRRRMFHFGAKFVQYPPLSAYGLRPHDMQAAQETGAQPAAEPAVQLATVTRQPAPPITSQMLRQALDMFGGPHPSNFAAGSTSAASSSAAFVAQPQLPALVAEEAMEAGPDYAQLCQLYGNQLAQMRDFGFVDDEENLRTLQVCDGNLERALELIISFRESDHP